MSSGGPSSGGNPSQIGAVSVGVGVDLAGLQAGLKQGEAMVQGSAQKMAASAVVPIGNKSGAAGPIDISRGVFPIGDKSAAAGMMGVGKETEKAKRSFIEAGIEGQKSFRNITSVITRTTGAIAAMGLAAKGVVKIIEGIWTGMHGGEVAANKFKAAIMDQGILKQFEAQADRITEINKLLKEREAMTVAERVYTAGQHAALLEEQKILIASQKTLDDSVKSIQAKTKAEQQRQDIIARGDEGSKRVRQENADEDIDSLERKQELARGIREDAAEKQKTIEDEAKVAQDIHDERMAQVQEIADANKRILNPRGAAVEEHNKVLRALDYAERHARTDREREEIRRARRLAMEGTAKGFQDAEDDIRRVMGDAISGALAQQASAAGVQNTTLLLRDIGMAARSIQMTIPRDFTGPMQGLPNGGM